MLLLQPVSKKKHRSARRNDQVGSSINIAGNTDKHSQRELSTSRGGDTVATATGSRTEESQAMMRFTTRVKDTRKVTSG